MSDSLRGPRSSRTWAALAVAVVVVAVVAAAIGYPLLQDEPSSAPMDRVPQRADAVAHVDADETTSSEARREFAVRASVVLDDNPLYRGPRVGRWTGAFAGSERVDLAEARGLTFFVALDENATRDPDYGAVVVDAPWSESALVRAVEAEADVTLRRTDEGGRTIYAPEGGTGPTVAALADGSYAVGDRAAVVDAQAVAADDAEPVRGPLRERFRAAREGYVTLAYPFPHEAVSGVSAIAGQGFTHAQFVTGVYYANETANGTRLGMQFGLHTNDSDAARDLERVVEFGVPIYAANSPDPVVQSAADEVRIQRRGRSVLVVYEAEPDRALAVVERLD